MRWRAALACAALCAGAGLTPSALAQSSEADDTPSRARARELFRDGNALVDQAKYAEALERFESAYALWDNPKIKLNIATSLRALGRSVQALEAYRHYLRQAEPSSERRAEVEAICAELEARLALVELRVAPDVVRLSLDGRPLEVRERHDLILEPGHHVVSAETAAGEHDVNIDVVAGERRDLSVEGPEPSESASSTPIDAPPEAPRRVRFSPVGLALRMDIDGGGGGVVGAGGLVYAFDSHWQVSAGGLFGSHAGAWAGLEVLLFDGPLRPSLGISAPVFFVDPPAIGVSAEAGARWAVLEESFFVTVRAALVHFPTVPEGYERTVFVPSIGSELRL